MSRATPKILIAAGETGTGEELRDQLRRSGYVVTDLVATAEQARKSIRNTPPDLLLLHADLKGSKDGVEAAVELRSKKLPLIVLAARSDLRAHQRVQEIAVDGFLTTPASDEDLLPAVEAALRSRAEPDETREQEERFQLLFRHHEAVMLLLDPATGNIIDANGAAEKFYGYAGEKLRSMNIREINTLPAEEIVAAYGRALRREQTRFVFPHRLADGTLRTVEVHSSPFVYQNRNVLLSIIHDVTQKQNAENQIREMNTFMASMMESSSSISIISTDLDGLVEYWNIGATKLFGFTAEEMVGRQTVALLYPKGDRETMKAVMEIREIALEKKQSIRREVRQVTKYGKTLWVNLTVSPRLNATGDVVGLLGIGEDITERKAMEDVLARQTSLYETIFQAQSDIGEGFLLVQGERVLYANEAFASTTGYTVGELLGLPSYLSLIAPEYRDAVVGATSRNPGGLSAADRFEGVMIRKDGTKVDFEGALRPTGQAPGQMIGIFRDISDRKRAEQELRLLGQTVASTKDCFSITDMDDKILFVNEAFCRTYGYEEKDLLGRPISLVRPPNSGPGLAEAIRPATLAGGWNGEIVNCRKDGSTLPIELWTSVVRNDKGEPVALVGVARDITERKRAERLQQSVYKMAELALTGKSLEGVLRSIHEEIETLVPAKNFSIALYDRMEDLITFPYFVDECEPAPSPHKPGRGLTEYVLRKGEPLLAPLEGITALVKSGEIQSMKAPPTDWLGVPLNVEGECIGVLALQSRSPDVRFSQQDRDVLMFVSTQVAMTVQRKRVEELIQNSERKFRAVFEHANDAILLINGVRLFDCNPRAEQMFLLPRAKLIGLPLSALFAAGGPKKGSQKQGVAAILDRVRGGSSESFEWRLQRSDGAQFDAEASLNAVDLEGRSMVQTVIRDVTERKRNERVVQESEQRLRRITENMLDMITQIDLSGMIEYVSPSVKMIFGYEPQDLIGTNAYDLLHPNDTARVTEESLRALSSPSVWRMEYRMKHARGSYVWVESTINPTAGEDGKVVGFTIGSRDITHRKEVEELTRLDELRLETLLKLNESQTASPRELERMALEGGVRITGSTMGFLAFVNEEQGTLTMHAWSEGAWSLPASEDQLKPMRLDQTGILGEAVLQRKPVIMNEPPAGGQRKNVPPGHPTIARHLVVPIYDGARIVAVVGVANKEDDYRQSDVRQLTLLVEGMWMTLQRRSAEAQIRDSLREKEVLLKEIHHRVKNNLQIISSLLNLQSDRVKDSPHLDIFRDSQNRIRSMALVHEKLYRSSDLAAIDFSQYIQSLTAYLYRSYAADEREVRLDLDIGNVFLGVDAAIPCGLIINELVSNSLKHAFPSMKGGVVRVVLSQQGNTCTLEVSDNGIGFPPAVNFWETESLGLQLVHTLATQIGADMELSHDGGTRFVFRFPAAAEK